MTDDLLTRLALEHPSVVSEVGAKSSSPLTIAGIKRVGAPGSTVTLGRHVAPPGGVVAGARRQGKSAFALAFEAAITAEDECLARMMQAEGIDTTGMAGRLGQPLAPVGPPDLGGDPDELVTVPVEGAPAGVPMVMRVTRRQLAELAEHGAKRKACDCGAGTHGMPPHLHGKRCPSYAPFLAGLATTSSLDAGVNYAVAPAWGREPSLDLDELRRLSEEFKRDEAERRLRFRKVAAEWNARPRAAKLAALAKLPKGDARPGLLGLVDSAGAIRVDDDGNLLPWWDEPAPPWQPTAEYAAQVRACKACPSGACSRHHPDDRATALAAFPAADFAGAVAEFDASQGPDFIMGHLGGCRIVPAPAPERSAERKAKARDRKAERQARKAGRKARRGRR